MSVASIAQSIWEHPTRTTQSGSPDAPTTRLDYITQAVWASSSRTTYSGGGVISYRKKATPSTYSSSSRDLIWNKKSSINQQDCVFFGGGQFPNCGTRYTDSSPRGNHGILMPDAATGPQWRWVPELGRYGMVFDSSNMVSVADSASLGGMAALTVSLWYFRTGGNVYNRLISKNDITDFAIHGSAPINYRVQSDAVIGTNMVANAWTHCCMTYDGATIQGWKNGVVDGSPVARTAAVPDSAASLGIGNRPGDYLRGIIGLIVDPLILNTALSPAQISWLANPANHLLVPKPRIYAVATTTTPLVPPSSYVYPNTHLYISKRRHSLYLRNFR